MAKQQSSIAERAIALILQYQALAGPKDAFENEGKRDHGVCRSQQLDRWSR
jgi:hypothetical protein